MRSFFKIALLGLAAFVLCRAAEVAFFADVVPIADRRDQPVGPLEAAFLLRSLEYIGLFIAALALLAMVARQAADYLKRS